MREPIVEVHALVVEHCRSGFFKCRLLGDDDHLVLARVSSQMDRHRIKVAPGDEVRVTLSPYDLTRGRITYRFKTAAA